MKDKIISIIKGYECDAFFGANLNHLKEEDYDDVAKDIIKLFYKPIVSGLLISDIDYWEQRCLLSEKCLEESHCNTDITASQINDWDSYHDFIIWSGNNK